MSDREATCHLRNGCEREFAEIGAKLDRLDEAIRGNGKPGITLRLDRLEQDARRQSRILWMIIGSIVTTTISMLAAWLH